MPNAVVLLSGGLDSTTCVAYAISKGFTVSGISFAYGQRHCAELEAAKKIATQYSLAQHQIVELPMTLFNSSALVDTQQAVPDFSESEEIPTTYVPARNTIFLSLALGFAEGLEAEAIFIGASSVDYSGYPDCRPEYFTAFETMANLATQAGVEGRPIKIVAPLLHLSKAETIQLGLSLGVDYGQTVSCYQADTEGRACGRCDSCGLRKKGFHDAEVMDPTRYG